MYEGVCPAVVLGWGAGPCTRYQRDVRAMMSVLHGLAVLQQIAQRGAALCVV